MNRARSACSIVATTAVVVTLITCVAIAKSQDIYVGGLAWPFLSDMGRDPPAYYVFVVGLCITAASLLFVWFFNYGYQSSAMAASSSGCHKCLRTFVAVCGMLSAFALPILSICDTARFPSVHNASAYAFFCLEALAVLCNTVLTYRIYKQRNDDERYTMDGLDRQAVARVRRQAWHETSPQLTVAVLFLTAFIVYLPVGLALSCEFEHLTIAKCLDLKLGTDYCTTTMMLNSTSTKLWDYSSPDCTSVHQMRAGAQLACILTLVGYSLTFIFNYQDMKKHVEDDRSAYAVAGP